MTVLMSGSKIYQFRFWFCNGLKKMDVGLAFISELKKVCFVCHLCSASQTKRVDRFQWNLQKCSSNKQSSFLKQLFWTRGTSKKKKKNVSKMLDQWHNATFVRVSLLGGQGSKLLFFFNDNIAMFRRRDVGLLLLLQAQLKSANFHPI